MDGLNSYLGYLEINLPFFEVAGYDGSDKELVRLFDATKEFKCPDRIYTRQIAEFSDKYLFPSAYVQGDASSNASSDSSGDASGDALGDINTSGYASGDTEGDAEDGVSNMIEIASILRDYKASVRLKLKTASYECFRMPVCRFLGQNCCNCKRRCQKQNRLDFVLSWFPGVGGGEKEN